MFTITFTVDKTEHSIELQPERGDLNELYRSGDEIVDRIERRGFEFTGDLPSFQELSRRHRESRDHESLDLGDLSDVVRDRTDGAADEDGGSRDDASDRERTDSEDDPETVELEFVGPEGNHLQGTYRPNQPLGAVQADLAEQADLDRDQQVVLYRSSERDRSLPNQTPLADLAGQTLYWETEQL